MAEVILKNICKVYDGGVKAVNDVNIDIHDQEFVYGPQEHVLHRPGYEPALPRDQRGRAGQGLFQKRLISPVLF